MPMIEFGPDWKRPVYLGFTLDLNNFSAPTLNFYLLDLLNSHFGTNLKLEFFR